MPRNHPSKEQAINEILALEAQHPDLPGKKHTREGLEALKNVWSSLKAVRRKCGDDGPALSVSFADEGPGEEAAPSEVEPGDSVSQAGSHSEHFEIPEPVRRRRPKPAAPPADSERAPAGAALAAQPDDPDEIDARAARLKIMLARPDIGPRVEEARKVLGPIKIDGMNLKQLKQLEETVGAVIAGHTGTEFATRLLTAAGNVTERSFRREPGTVTAALTSDKILVSDIAALVGANMVALGTAARAGACFIFDVTTALWSSRSIAPEMTVRSPNEPADITIRPPAVEPRLARADNVAR